MSNKYEIQPIQTSDYESVATTYAEVFAGKPWEEVSRCNECDSFSKTKPQEVAVCGCGGAFSLEAYPLEETVLYIGDELNKPDASGYLLTQLMFLQSANYLCKGFGWGYAMSSQDLVEKKYQTQEMQQVVSELLVSTGFFFYVSEVGVLPELQGQGYGKDLTNKLVDSGRQKGYQNFVVRTNEDSPMRYILDQMGMKPILGLQTGIKDSENESRVLFVGKK